MKMKIDASRSRSWSMIHGFPKMMISSYSVRSIRKKKVSVPESFQIDFIFSKSLIRYRKIEPKLSIISATSILVTDVDDNFELLAIP